MGAHVSHIGSWHRNMPTLARIPFCSNDFFLCIPKQYEVACSGGLCVPSQLALDVLKFSMSRSLFCFFQDLLRASHSNLACRDSRVMFYQYVLVATL